MTRLSLCLSLGCATLTILSREEGWNGAIRRGFRGSRSFARAQTPHGSQNQQAPHLLLRSLYLSSCKNLAWSEVTCMKAKRRVVGSSSSPNCPILRLPHGWRIGARNLPPLRADVGRLIQHNSIHPSFPHSLPSIHSFEQMCCFSKEPTQKMVQRTEGELFVS